MSGTTGKTSTYIRNGNVKESTQINTGFKKVRFLHQATAGDTLIQLGSLVAPTGAVNYSAPSATELAQTNLMQWPGNVELVSSISGRLMQNVAYICNGAATIKLLYSARDGEIFEGIVDYGARTGLTMVDAAPIVATGTLSAGSTDFNVGTPFQVGLYPTYQVGAVMVFVDRALQSRNTSNGAPAAGVDGDYYEVHSGSGLGSIIRFNTVDLINDRQVMVISVNGLVERPSGSFMAVMEVLQGQIDAMVPTLAALADVAETTFQGTPNNVDLKSFGDRVFTLEKILDGVAVPLVTAWAAYTPTLTGFGTASNISFMWRRNGDSIEIKGTFTAGTVAAVTVSMTLPGGLSIDSNKVSLANTTAAAGPTCGIWTENTANPQRTNAILATGTSTTLIYAGGPQSSTPLVAVTGSGGFATGQVIAVEITAIPIVGYAATQTVRQALGL